MATDLYRYKFDENVSVEDVEAALLLAVWGCEALHGESQTRLDAAHYLHPASRACVIHAGTLVGRDLNRLFVRFLERELGPDSFRIERITRTDHQPKEAAA
ncbi:MAG: hypothetical protein DCC68_05165 [Planctomycetota bacterium]|nr:MAG: hypothetical protein DCC68_05165 [Planctomycetota bacterium]